MQRQQTVLLTKINPPQVSAHALVRPRVTSTLLEGLQYRVTVVQAGAGYGKSTAVMALVQQHQPVIWYQISREDSDPFVFLQHLLHAIKTALPAIEGLPIAFLEAWDSSRGPLPTRELLYRTINELNEGLEQPTFLILEDIHLAVSVQEINQIVDQLISLAPHQLHLVLTTRSPLDFPSRSRWVARGQLLQVDQTLLAFTPEEITQLFKQRFGYDLTAEEIDFLVEATEGWAITLQMIGQSLRRKSASTVKEALNLPSASLDTLFEILAKEVLDLQPPEIRQFMKVTSTLQLMTPEACDAFPELTGSAETLELLHRQDLFVFKVIEGQFRYHHTFHRFLRRQSDEAARKRWNRQAAAYFREAGDLDACFYHALKAGDERTAAEILTVHGEDLLRKGHFKTLNEMLDGLAPRTLHQHPVLLFLLGDLARLHSRFQEAIGWYQQAEALWRERGQPEGISRALRGQARVYLDTVNPSRAEELLQQALRLSDGTADRDTMAKLYELLAENKLNAGKGEEAVAYRNQAQDLRREGPADSQLLIRVLLRTGRLGEARQQLEQQLELERSEPVQQPRAHRETLLLLSIICAMQGEPQTAYEAALEGTQRGERLGSPSITAVGYIRQGHALMMTSQDKRFESAMAKFEHAIELSRSLHIPRLRVEAYWGLARAYGYRGELVEARRMADRGIEIANRAGDEWIASILRCTLGACYILADEAEEGHEWLAQAMHGFQACSDPFGLASARLWRCMEWFEGGEEAQFADSFRLVLEASMRHGYDSLLTKPTLLGVPDERRLVPLLLAARQQGWSEKYPDRLLHEMGLGMLQIHPGYQLRIQTMGGFNVWRGEEKIHSNEWKREKARQLLQVLIANRAAPLDRDQICECLWPGMEPGTSHRNFKVALSTLYQVLEPARDPGSDSAYILRQGSTYALRPDADLWLDVVEFDRAIEQADGMLVANPGAAFDRLAKALDLYQGEFLADALYETWSAAERERLTIRFLRSCDRLCEWNLETRPEAVVGICQRVLLVDNCWERAYRFMMQAYAKLGDHGRVARTFQTCLEVLRSELDVAPAAQTFELYRTLIQSKE